MNLKFAEYIVALSETRNVTRAAAKLGITQSALSNFLIKHEKEENIKIFMRYKNTLIPTERGQRYISALRQMCTLKTYAYQRIRACCGQVTDEIRIGVTPSQGMKYLTDSYSTFVKRHPTTKVNIVEEYSAKLKILLLNHEIDMFYGAQNENEVKADQWTTYKACRIRLVAAMHKYFAADLMSQQDGRLYSSILCRQLQELPMILHGEKTSMRRAQDELFLKERFTPVIIAEGNNSHMIKKLVKQGLGVGFLPEYDIDGGELEDIVCFYIDSMPYIYRGIVIRKGYSLNEAETCLAELMWSYESRKGETYGSTAD